jgi:hypothetical protein
MRREGCSPKAAWKVLDTTECIAPFGLDSLGESQPSGNLPAQSSFIQSREREDELTP